MRYAWKTTVNGSNGWPNQPDEDEDEDRPAPTESSTSPSKRGAIGIEKKGVKLNAPLRTAPLSLSLFVARPEK